MSRILAIFFICFYSAGLIKTAPSLLLNTGVKIKVTHSHEVEEHGHEHSHDSEESDDHHQQASHQHSHEFVVAVPTFHATNVQWIEIDQFTVTAQHDMPANQLVPVGPDLSSIFRPPIA